MRHCLIILNNKGKVHYAVLLFIVSLITILFSMIIEKRVLINMRDKLDNELVITAFSGGVFDLQKLYASVRLAKTQSCSETTYDFEKIYENLNLYIDHENAYDTVENILANNMVGSDMGSRLISNIEIDTLIIYNLYNVPEIHQYNENGYVGKVIGNAANLITPNGISVDTTSIYVKIGFELKGFLGITRNLYLEKCISLEY